MKNKGFTLLELVCVVAVLGVLAVTAAPKFLEIQDDARTAALHGFKGAFLNGLDMISSKHKIAGEPDSLELGEAKLMFRGVGEGEASIAYEYPVVMSALDCVEVWNAGTTGIQATVDDMVGIGSIGDEDSLFTAFDISSRTCFYAYGTHGHIAYRSGWGDVHVEVQ